MTWIFAYCTMKDSSVVFQYLFCIFNSAQGLLIFIFHIARDVHVIQEWKTCLCVRRKSRGTSSANQSLTNQTDRKTTVTGFTKR